MGVEDLNSSGKPPLLSSSGTVGGPTSSSATAETPSAEQTLEESENLSRCGPAWPQFWAIVMLSATAEVLLSLILPSLATKYFNGGVDPCLGDGHSSPECKDATAKSASIQSSFNLVSTILGFLGGPLFGLLSDRIGRRPLLILCQILTVLKLASVLATEMMGVSLYLYFILGSVIFAPLPAVMIFYLWITDKTKPHERLALFATLGAAMDCEEIVAPLFGAIFGPRSCLLIGNAFAIASLAICLGFIPETLPKEQRQREPLDVKNAYALTFLFTDHRFQAFGILALLGNAMRSGCMGIFQYFLELRFGKVFSQISGLIFLNGLGALVFQLYFVNSLSKCLGLRKLVYLALAVGIFNSLVICLAPTYNFLYAIALLGGFTTAVSPAITASCMNFARAEERGRVQGALTSILTLSGGLGPVVYSGMLSLGEKPLLGPEVTLLGLPYAANAVLTLIFMFIWSRARIPEESSQVSCSEGGARSCAEVSEQNCLA
eukprot:TRINITY_DN93303_c0_g1_i1.p1 TRINITY_DN93303_c0_g1~~TRINITY_DN93303_c0_g1_i1.p1  ORF type:complete len:491 (+),score=50.95 TRINITY_DN93303_c0_g1_i1:264-1736(+)